MPHYAVRLRVPAGSLLRAAQGLQGRRLRHGDRQQLCALPKNVLPPIFRAVPYHPESLDRHGRCFSRNTMAHENLLQTLPATAQICSCNNVSKSAICAAVTEGCATMGAVQTRTKAAAACGGCASAVAQILNDELRRKGVALNRHLCEHFAYSRPQLFRLVRMGNLRNFGAVIAQHGRGRGCDICKPAIASILASCWNAFLTRERSPSQDTKDRHSQSYRVRLEARSLRKAHCPQRRVP